MDNLGYLPRTSGGTLKHAADKHEQYRTAKKMV